jgi:hypothetical protein
MQMQKGGGEGRRPARTSEAASNTLSRGGFPDQLLVGGEKCLCDEKPNGIVQIAVWPLWPGSIGSCKTGDEIPSVAGAPGRLFTWCGACLVYCRPIRLSSSRFTPTRPALIASLPGSGPTSPVHPVASRHFELAAVPLRAERETHLSTADDLAWPGVAGESSVLQPPQLRGGQQSRQLGSLSVVELARCPIP